MNDDAFKNHPNHALLVAALQAAVPLWIAQLKQRSYAYVLERAKVCGQHVAEHGDLIQFRSRRRDGTAQAFNHLAEGLACLAFSPSGVTFIGVHFEATHAEAPSRCVALGCHRLAAHRFAPFCEACAQDGDLVQAWMDLQ